MRALTDANGNVIQACQSDAFGNPTQTQGGISQPFQYTGQQRDAESGLYYLRARMYDPTSERFVSRDPLFGFAPVPLTLNRFGYAANNPTTRIDPSGFSSNRVTTSGSTDNPCFTSASGQLGGNVISAACLNTSFGMQGFALVRTPSGDIEVVPFVVFAKPPQGGGGSGRTTEDGVPVGRLKKLSQTLLDWLGGENYTGPIKKAVGKSRVNLVYDPDTGRAYTVPTQKGAAGAPQWVDTLPEGWQDHVGR